MNIAREASDPVRLVKAAFVHASMLSGPDTGVENVLQAVLDHLGQQPPPESVLVEGILLLHRVEWRGRGQYFDRLSDLLAEARIVGDPRVVGLLLLMNAYARRGSPLEPDVPAMIEEAASLADVDAEVLPGFKLLFLGMARLALGDRTGFDEVNTEWTAIAERSAGRIPTALGWPHLVAQMEGRWADAVSAAHTWRQFRTYADNPGLQLISMIQTGAAMLEAGRGPETIEATRALSGGPARAVLVGCLVDAGRHAEARAELEALLHDEGLDALPDNSSQPLWIRWLVDVASHLEDTALAGDLYPIVAPYSGLLLVPFMGPSVEGAADRCIAQLAQLLGRPDEAEGRYTAALALERSVGAHAQEARTLYWYARFLTAQRDQRALELCNEAVTKATALGMKMLERQARTLLDSRNGIT
jgi:hypothetical protein